MAGAATSSPMARKAWSALLSARSDQTASARRGPVSVTRDRPLRSQSRRVVSAPPEARVLPSAEKARQAISSLWPLSRQRICAVVSSQTQIWWSNFGTATPMEDAHGKYPAIWSEGQAGVRAYRAF